MKKIITALCLTVTATAALTSCAAGAATAGYALRAQTADTLTAVGEQHIVDRAKREIMAEMSNQCSLAQPATVIAN